MYVYIYICITITNYYQHVLTIIPYDSRINLSLLDHFGHGIIPPNPERHVRRVRLPGEPNPPESSADRSHSLERR